ncbi:uncharacterized protein RCH25_044181 [Pelodytes ibericus]
MARHEEAVLRCVARQRLLYVQNVCPPFDPSMCLVNKAEMNQCKSDRECPSNSKCCCSKCGWKCVSPVQVKSGRCPATSGKCQHPKGQPECQQDRDCPKKQKCCDMCGKKCWDPEADPYGFCPGGNRSEVQSPHCSLVMCISDYDCPPDEKCCWAAGKQKCVKSSPGKKGRCPAIMSICSSQPQDPQCDSDTDCPGEKKCCNICGNSCFDPVIEPAEVCPAPDLRGDTVPCSSHLCNNDDDCSEEEKCCLFKEKWQCVQPPKRKQWRLQVTTLVTIP